jgi:protein associated with RNAse G/E
MWNPGEVVTWRGIFNGRVWHAQPTIVVKDSPEELVLTLLPGTECAADENYPKGKKYGKRRWEFMDNDWTLAKYTWHTNRLLLILEPETYYSTIYFWNHTSNEFVCYYINFQQPFKRVHCGIDTLDLELDIIINSDFSYEWKDRSDYEMCISAGMITPEWVQEIDKAKEDILGRLAKRQYPLDGSWLDWMPDPNWSPPKLPENWDKI